MFAFSLQTLHNKKYIYFLFFCCFIALFLHGCAKGNVGNATKNSLKNPEYLYGNGSGLTLEVAKQYALQDLTTNLQVSIKYVAKDSVQQTNNTLQTNASSNIILESQIKDLPAIEVDKITKENGKVSVRLKVEKSILMSQILNRIQTNQQTLDSILEVCQAPAFNQYKQFKRVLQDYKSDTSLYRILSKNMSYANTNILHYQEIVDTLPSYQVTIDFKGQHAYTNELKNIIHAELSKFIKIDSKATKSLHISVSNDSTLMLYLNFYDCKQNLETSFQINTYMHESELSKNAQKTRIAAIIYKYIETMY